MHHIYPTTKLTRGSLSGHSLLAVALLLLVPASQLLTTGLMHGLPVSGVLGALLMIAGFPFAMRWGDYRMGCSKLSYCDEFILAVQETPRRMYHVRRMADLKRIVCDSIGYTFVLKNGRQFRVHHKDAGPEHTAVLSGWHARMENALKASTDMRSDPTVA